MGSGKKLNVVYKKYGKKNFEKEILRFFDSPEEMFEHERRIVTKDLVKNPMCYNLTEGGDGYRIGHTVTDETRKKISIKNSGKPSKTKGSVYYHLGTKIKCLNPSKFMNMKALAGLRAYISQKKAERD